MHEHPTSVRDLIERDPIEFTAHGVGHKSSEGDGRTAADIEAENERAAAQATEERESR
jgi:hypothetical protein